MKAQPLSHLVDSLKSCFTNKVQTHKIGQGFPTFMGFYLTLWYFLIPTALYDIKESSNYRSPAL